MMKSLGFQKSDMSKVADASKFKTNTHLPMTYDMCKECNKVIDQGSRGICVSVSLNDVFKSSLTRMNKTFQRPIDYYYNKRQDKKIDGMTVKEAMEMAVKDGDIKSFAKIQDVDTLKYSIFNNGACAVALPVKDMDDEVFWKGNKLYGGHCVVFVGWTKNSFILKNSWGYSYGDGGLTYFPFEDFKYVLEVWTVLR